MKIKKYRSMINRIIYTVFTVVFLCGILFSMISYLYSDAENASIEMLHIRTKEIKDDITLQLKSDRENLITIAGMAENLYAERNKLNTIVDVVKPMYADGYDYSILFESFESIGLIDEIAMLFPGGNYITKDGVTQIKGFSYIEEAQRAPYITGRVPALTGTRREVIRSSVPIKAGGETIGVLYGITELDSLKERYVNTVNNMNARLYLIERGNGNFIVDTWSDELGNLKYSSVLENKKGYSYDEMKDDIFDGGKGFCAYKSSISKVFMYSHYSPLEIGDWTIVLSMPEEIVFKDAHSTRDKLMLMFFAIIVVVVIYMVVVFGNEKRISDVASTASQIRKHLLIVSGNREGINRALKDICDKCRGRATFYVDSQDNDFNYSDILLKDAILSGADRDYFCREVFAYAKKTLQSDNTTIWVSDFMSEMNLEKTNPKFYTFLKEHGINSIYIAAINGKNEKMSILGITNPKRKFAAREILKEVSVCFSISVHNKDYLDRTEYDAVTDALTGIPNRVSYKRDIVEFDKNIIENFACMYIDVNELHAYNNKYGHAAGDEMLIYVASAIKKLFGLHRIYRMGGDEFLVFTVGLTKDVVQTMIEELNSEVEKKGYHISVGMSYSIKNIDTETSVREAEKNMYNEKAKYYQQKEMRLQEESRASENKPKFIETGDRDLDVMTKLLGGQYSGVYLVNLNTDQVCRVIMQSYMNIGEKEEKFSEIFKEYVSTYVHNDSQRGMFRFLNYEVLNGELASGETPRFTYQKTNGEYQVLTVYAQGEETLWVFENAQY